MQVKAVPGSRYSTQVDVWACGVILYVLLSGAPPFFHADLKGLYKQIMHAQYAFQDPVWDAVSDQCALHPFSLASNMTCAPNEAMHECRIFDKACIHDSDCAVHCATQYACATPGSRQC